MKPERMRIRIAEYLGAKWHWTTDRKTQFLTFKEWDGDLVLAGEEKKRRVCVSDDIPNYPACLNACHQLEKKLNRDQQMEYAECLTEHFSEEFCDLGGTAEHVFACAHLTAEQRCESFCRTVGIYE